MHKKQVNKSSIFENITRNYLFFTAVYSLGFVITFLFTKPFYCLRFCIT